MAKKITKVEIEAARQELERAMLHMMEADRILKPHANDDGVYQVLCLIPTTGAKRAMGWLREIPVQKEPVQKEGNDG